VEEDLMKKGPWNELRLRHMSKVYVLPQAIEGTQMTYAKSLNLPHGQIKSGSLLPGDRPYEIIRKGIERRSFPLDAEMCDDLESIVLQSVDEFPWTAIKKYLDINMKVPENEKRQPNHLSFGF
jgi:hypothetical protein